MTVISSFNNLDKRFAWSFLGFMLAAILGSLTIYTEFFRVDNPELIVEVLNDTNVLDVKEDMNELKVFYGDVDIKSLNQTLSVVFLRIKNDGGAPILKGYYDDKYPLNLTIKDGKFLKSEQVSSTNDYLKSSALPIIDTERSILLPGIILEHGESYTIKVLALHSAGSDVELNVLGKIAGVREIRLTKSIDSEEEISFWSKVIAGDIFVHLARIPIYFFGFIFSIILMIAPIAIASDFFSKRKRRKVIKQYKLYIKEDITDKHEFLFESYIDDGLVPVAEAKETLSDKEKLKKVVRKGLNPEARSHERHPERHDGRYPDRYDRSHPDYQRVVYRRAAIYRLLKGVDGFIKDENNEIMPAPHAEDLLGKFIDFVVIKES
ncbi:hypothetical protein [Pseudoalteromonas tunicata]|jgi:hypothetical protein|uniref:Uncharacterized protein n=1 Tax=Pseudoalteromonas tunicata D2 TaxID=87626 RepID=A4CAU9_9GAMM|nr:hypothetical protein [Pseudoalteromonas tunicata]ATC95053.1 hypothetical protein PTUN_a2593 [Pseudoalteromonas tunicata]AXT30700.1 hypothetical protein D1819_07625 [Pseudoalteromonas tunicata]EAR28507.1 hypothetical protein PTD2_21867 [Pseudoalteromonas tunicata D2]